MCGLSGVCSVPHAHSVFLSCHAQCCDQSAWMHAPLFLFPWPSFFWFLQRFLSGFCRGHASRGLALDPLQARDVCVGVCGWACFFSERLSHVLRHATPRHHMTLVSQKCGLGAVPHDSCFPEVWSWCCAT
ncbi:unnamed protein product [Discosporangium mesarthrocarpum]